MTMRGRLFLGCLLVCAATGPWPAFGQTAPKLATQVEELVRQEMQQRKLPSVSLLVMKNQRTVYRGAFGWARTEPSVLATPSTRYRLDSLTKQFTAAALLLLQQRGRVHIADPVSRYLPDAPASWRGIRIVDVLNHTAGFPRDASAGYSDLADQERNPHALLQRLYAMTPLSPPGRRWQYSNAGYALLGALIEIVSGQGYGEFLRQNLFLPAGMTDTQVDDQNYGDPRLALGYAWSAASGHWLPRSQENSAAAAASVQSTVLDLAKWELALQGETILSCESKRQMWNTVPPPEGDDYGYGFGWFVRDGLAGQMIFHGGSGWGYSTAFHRYPDAGYTVIVLTNLQPDKDRYHGDAIAEAVALLFDPRLREEAEPARQARKKNSSATGTSAGYK